MVTTKKLVDTQKIKKSKHKCLTSPLGYHKACQFQQTQHLNVLFLPYLVKSLSCSVHFFLVSFPEKTSWSSQEVEHFLWTLFLPQQFLLHSTSDPLLLLPNVCQICPLFSMFTTSTFTLAPSTISYLTANLIS